MPKYNFAIHKEKKNLGLGFGHTACLLQTVYLLNS